MPALFQILFLLLFPLAAIFLAGRVKVFSWIGPVVLCYAGGVLLALTPDAVFTADAKLSDTIASVVVPLGIPLLLFSTDFPGWFRYAGGAVLSFGLAIVSVLVSSTAAFYFLGDTVPGAADISGMLVGVYTGGTPNMAAIGKALEVPENTYLLIQTADVLIGGVYLLFLLSIAHRVALLFLRPFTAPADDGDAADVLDSEDMAGLEWRDIPPILLGAGLSVLVVVLSAAVAVGLVLVAGYTLDDLGESIQPLIPPLFLGITTFAIAASFLPAVRSLRGSYESGEYLILIFCVAMGSMVQPGSLFDTGGDIIVYCLFVMGGSIVLHYFLGWLFRVDADTLIITSTAALYGPPFIPPVCEAIRNRRVLVSGLTTGLVGYAVGNYLGYTIAQFLAA